MTFRGASGGVDQAALLDEVSWIRRLARELASDRDLADDLVQDACVAALESAPREPLKLRQWLAQVLRNSLRQRARAQGRRSARERASARPEALEPTDRLVERVALQRELVGAVLELDEPYRSTVLLRFFEELPPREIAARQGVPVATVQSRLTRALARLRERLDGEHRAWATVLLPWIRALEPLGHPTLLTALMKTKLTLVAMLAALAAGAFVWSRASDESARASSSAAAPAGAPHATLAPVPAVDRPLEAAPAPARVAAAPGGAKPAETAAAPAEAPAWTVRLRVLDAEASPMSGIAVRTEGRAEILGTSNAGGWCVFETRSDRLVLSAADPRWVTIHEGSPARESSLDPVLVLAPAVDLSGVVANEAGGPLAQASVRFELPVGFHARFSENLEATRTQGWRTQSGPDGRFAFERVPAVAGAHLGAVLAGYERDEIEAPGVPRSDLELVLLRPRLPLAGVLRGQVLEPTGAAVSGARVGLGLASVVSDEDGQFELRLSRAVTSEVLTAVKAGYLPAVLERPEPPRGDSSGWPERVTLVLAGPALSIRGVVLDHEKKPVPGAKVWLHDPTPAAPVGQMPTHLEPQMAGAPLPPQALESEANLPDQDGDNFWDWYTNAGEPSALWHWVTTDGSGAFELPGLDQRSYRLDVLRPGSLEVVTSPSIRAGARDAVIELGPPDIFERVSARVVSQDGQPLAGVSVSLFAPMVDMTARVFGGRSQVVLLEVAGQATTDGEGLVTFARVPRKGAQLSIRADGIVPESVEVTQESFEVEVEQRLHVEVVLRPPVERFDDIRVFDGDGKPLDILVLTEGSTNAWTDLALIDGRSGIFSVSSRARELRLFKDRALVETVPLDLVAGEVNRIEP